MTLAPSCPAPAPTIDRVAASDPARARTYAQILSSTVIIGGSSVANVVFGIVRSKAIALLLGPSGVGLMGVYTSIVEVTQSLAGMGIQSSGVRQIAEAVGSDDTARIARTAAVLRRVAFGLGALGALLLAALSGPVSEITFGTREPAAGVAALSLAVLFREIAAGQGALIQGMRRIADLARLTVLAALAGTVITVPLVYWWGPAGVVPSIVAVAAASIVTSSWYSRKVRLPKASITLRQVRQETSALLGLGSAFMVTSFLTMGTAYVIRAIVLRTAGLDAAGLYQAAWTLGGLYVAFILQAMGADFYPRLTAVAGDSRACNRAVNQQAHVSLLLAGPGVIATLTLSPLVIAVFYSSRFSAAVPLLRWVCLGMTLRVIAWPMGYVVVAKGRQAIMILTEVVAAVVHVGLAWTLLRVFGLAGAGAAFFGMYASHTTLIYAVVRRMTGFRWSLENRKIAAIFLPLTGLTFGGFYVLPAWLAVAVGLSLSLATGLYSARTLLILLPPESTPRLLRRCLLRLSEGGRRQRAGGWPTRQAPEPAPSTLEP